MKKTPSQNAIEWSTMLAAILERLDSIAASVRGLAGECGKGPLPPMVAAKLLLDLARIDGELLEHKHRIPT